MSKVSIKTISSGYYSTDDLNQNFTALQTAIDNTLSRDGTSPNQVLADIDMNSKELINLKEGTTPSSSVTKNQVEKMLALYSTGYIASLAENQVATAGQTVFNLSQLAYAININNIDVYVNGVLQRTSIDYVETSPTVVTFTSGLSAGDIVIFRVNQRMEQGTIDVENVSGELPIVVDSIASLRTLTTNKKNVLVQGYYTPGDGGGGQFYWDATSVASDNGGTVILPTGYTGSGRWVRNDWNIFGEVDVRWFGALPDDATDSHSAIQAAMTFAVASGRAVRVIGKYVISATLSITSSNSLDVQGAGRLLSQIRITADADALAYSSTTGSCYVRGLALLGATAAAMTAGSAIRMTGGSDGQLPSLVVENLYIGTSGSGAFKYGITAEKINEIAISHTIIAGATASTIGINGIGSGKAVSWNISSLSVYNALYGAQFATTATPGIEGVKFTSCDFVNVSKGVVVTNTTGAGYLPPQYAFIGCHVNSTDTCIDISNAVQVFISDCLLYRNDTVGYHVRLAGVQGFTMTGCVAAFVGTGDVPAVMLDNAANGVITGNYFWLDGSTHAVVNFVTPYNIKIADNQRTGATNWLGSPLTTNLWFSGNNPPDPEDSYATFTPSGGAGGGGTLDISTSRSPYVNINATAGTITAVTAGNDKLVTLKCDTTGVVLEHNSSQLMPGGVNYTFSGGSTITLRRDQNIWRAVAST